MFRITCCYGTNKTAWSRAEALSWLAACGPQAQVTHRLTGRLLAARSVR